MKFIELTYYEFGQNILINIDEIAYILDDGEYRIIQTKHTGCIKVIETYEQILKEIQTYDET